MTCKSLAAALSLAAAVAVPAHAGVLFQDNFDADHVGSVLNVVSLSNWSIGNGTVDYIRSGDYGIHCVGSVGGCLDMDGSTNDAGRITSTISYAFQAGVTYTLTAQVSGNQRNYGPDDLYFGFVNTADNSAFATSAVGIPSNQAFGTVSYSWTPDASTAGTYRLFFEDLYGRDNVGVILDGVALSDNSRGGNVPEPASLVLTGLGLLALGASRRRR